MDPHYLLLVTFLLQAILRLLVIQTFTDSTTVSIEDSLLKLAANNVNTDTVDVGFYGVYNESGVKYSGIFRDASESGNVFKVWGGLTSEPRCDRKLCSRCSSAT